MRSSVTIFTVPFCLVACLVFGSSAVGRETEEPQGIVIWKATLDDPLAADLAIELMDEVNIQLIIERAEELPTSLDALEAMAAYRAMAVVWHDHNGTLRVLFRGEGEAQVVEAEAGSVREEVLYLREILAKRMGDEDSTVSDLLVTVPGEYVQTASRVRIPPVALPVQRPRPENKHKMGRWLAGVGYGARFHSDAVFWAQHSIVLTLPAIVFEDFVTARMSVRFGIPAVIGRVGYEWLEISTIEGTGGAGIMPVRFDEIAMEMGIGAGITTNTATAFLVSGHTQEAKHLSGHGAVWMATIWDPIESVRFRIYVDLLFLFRAPSFQIRGQGDFGSYPLQVGAGLDIEVVFY